MTAKKIREEMVKRKPDVVILWNMKAAEIKEKYGPMLMALDAESKQERNSIRMGKRQRREDKALESIEGGKNRKKAKRGKAHAGKTNAGVVKHEHVEEEQALDDAQAARVDTDGGTDPGERKRRIRKGKKKAT
jgi:hypothetical protein